MVADETTTPIFLKAAAKAAVKCAGNALGFGFAGDLLVEFGPAIAEDIWDSWGKNKNEIERRKEIEAVAQAAAKEVSQEVAEVPPLEFGWFFGTP